MLLKKTLSMVCAAAMCGMVFTGCWGKDDSSSASQSRSESLSQSRSESLSESRSESLSESRADSSSGVMSDVNNAGSNMMNGASNVISGAGEAVSDVMSGAGKAASDITDPGKASSSSSDAAMASAPAASNWQLRLVNAANPLPDDFEPETAHISGYENRPFDMRAADWLEKMLHDAEQEGCKLYLVSGYRSIGRQRALFQIKTESFVNQGLALEQAEQEASRWVARPGTSEHNLGLAADIVSADWYSTHNDLTEDFDQTPAFAWLKANCAEYGFILRYPKEKEAVTGISYEPWHYRYVGQEAAKQIMLTGITLEEYLQANPAGAATAPSA